MCDLRNFARGALQHIWLSMWRCWRLNSAVVQYVIQFISRNLAFRVEGFHLWEHIHHTSKLMILQHSFNKYLMDTVSIARVGSWCWAKGCWSSCIFQDRNVIEVMQVALVGQDPERYLWRDITGIGSIWSSHALIYITASSKLGAPALRHKKWALKNAGYKFHFSLQNKIWSIDLMLFEYNEPLAIKNMWNLKHK